MIYIQSDTERKLPHHFDAACAMYGAIDHARKFRLTSFEEVESGMYDFVIENKLFVGSVEFMLEVFKRVNITLDDIRLPRNSATEAEFITLGEAHQRVANGETLFIKPTQTKLFTGLVLDGYKYSCLNGLSDDTEVMAYHPFDSPIESEWRTYVKDNRIVDICCYSGDPFLIPNEDYINDIIERFDDMPKCYTIDVAVLKNRKNEVVEFNDMWAIGNYGIENWRYLQMLELRYFQIMKGIK